MLNSLPVSTTQGHTAVNVGLALNSKLTALVEIQHVTTSLVQRMPPAILGGTIHLEILSQNVDVILSLL